MEESTIQTEDVKFQVGLEEDDSSDSSCMVVLKLPSVEEAVPDSESTPMSRVTRRRTSKKVAGDENPTNLRCKRKRRIDSEDHTLALKRAQELQANLSSEHPSFIKGIRQSHVTRFYKLGVPSDFCRMHLPMHHNDVILEDESGESYMVKFLAGHDSKFVGGWKKFCVAHNLMEGDVVVLHLLRDCYFKVYIVKAHDPTVEESAIHSNPNVRTNEGRKKRKREPGNKKRPRLAPLDTVQESGGRRSPLLSGYDPGSSQSAKNGFNSPGTEDSECDSDFKKFKIVVNGETIDSELSRTTQFKYYKLCRSRGSNLHEGLLKNIDRTLAAGIIAGTLSVADAIRACKISTSEEDFAMWDDTLEGFTRLGMDVGFLRERLKRLARIGSELRKKEEFKSYIVAESEREGMLEEMKSLEVTLLELKQAKEKVEDEMKTMKVKNNIQKHKDDFHQEASAPW